MPIYEYQCEKCHHHLEVMQKFNDAPLTQCPACYDATGLKKLISPNSFHLKGSGWYASGYQKETGKTSSSSTPTESKAATSDTQSQGKTENKAASSSTTSSNESK